jgi:hypothetical protein
MEDYEADERGELPPDLKRGVHEKYGGNKENKL